MKIQNISTNKLYCKVNFSKTKTKNNPMLKNAPYDSISFGAHVPKDKVLSLQIEAYKIRQSSYEILDEAQNIKSDASQLFSESFEAYKSALELAESAKKYIKQGGMTLENGNFAAISFQVKDNKTTFCIEEFDEDDNVVREIDAALNLIPQKIIDYSLEKPRIYTFLDDTVQVTDEIDSANKNIGKIYRYSTEGLKKAMIDIDISQENPVYSKDFVFLGGKLILHTKNSRKEKGCAVADERYAFLDEDLKTYYEDFKVQDDNSASWSESYHCDKKRLLTHIQGASNSSGEDVIHAQNITYLSDCSEWEETKNGCCRLSDFGDVIIL